MDMICTRGFHCAVLFFAQMPIGFPLYLPQVYAEAQPSGKDPVMFVFTVTLTGFGVTEEMWLGMYPLEFSREA